MSDAANPLVGHVLGPLDEVELEGLLARAIVRLQPPYLCAYVDGQHEHYVAVTDCEVHAVCFEHVGPCDAIVDHPDCGHDGHDDWGDHGQTTSTVAGHRDATATHAVRAVRTDRSP